MTLPFPSFEDLRKMFQFWIDQQDKWFYFETAGLRNRSDGGSEVPDTRRFANPITYSRRTETVYYSQSRIVGMIGDVINYPPSLMLHDAKIIIVEFNQSVHDPGTGFISEEGRSRYGLVFSQIAYFEPVEDEVLFMSSDPRVHISEGD